MNLLINDLSKSYNGNQLFHIPFMELEGGGVYCLMGPSGSGKTTFLRLLLGLETPDKGGIEGRNDYKFSAVFQEDRLCETFSPVDNVAMVLSGRRNRQAIETELSMILPSECLHRPVSTLSGGMKRRTAICRAIMSPSHGVLMDEPFTGLDEDTKKQVIQYMKQRQNGRMLLISTHQPEDAGLLGGQIIHLGESSFS